VLRETPSDTSLWLEPVVNRTSLLYDRLSYVLRDPKIHDRFSYTYFHPAYFKVMTSLRAMKATVVPLKSICVDGYPSRGKKTSEESSDGIPIIKVRNVTGRGISLEAEYAPDTELTRKECAKALLQEFDVLITSTGEGTIGRVDVYPYQEAAIADGHVTICRLKPGINLSYVVEFLRSEFGQLQMLRHVSGSTGQTELLVDYIADLQIALQDSSVQDQIVDAMRAARKRGEEMTEQANRLREQSAQALAEARREMIRQMSLSPSSAPAGAMPDKPLSLHGHDPDDVARKMLSTRPLKKAKK